MAIYVENRKFPSVYLTLTLMGSHWNFVMSVGLKKARMMPLPEHHIHSFRHNTGIG